MGFSLDFAARSPLARRKPFEIPIDELLDAIRADLDRRRSTYPAMVLRGRLDQGEADRRCAVWAAIVADLERHHAMRRLKPAPASAEWTGAWAERVSEIRRELGKRRDTWPEWAASASHPMTLTAATLGLERLDALHHFYWNDLTDFSGPDVDIRDDHARIAWIAGMERRRIAPGSGPQLDLDESLAVWHTIEGLADRYARGVAGVDDYHACGRIVHGGWLSTQVDCLILDADRGDAPPHLHMWYIFADSWLLRRRTIVRNAFQATAQWPVAA